MGKNSKTDCFERFAWLLDPDVIIFEMKGSAPLLLPNANSQEKMMDIKLEAFLHFRIILPICYAKNSNFFHSCPGYQHNCFFRFRTHERIQRACILTTIAMPSDVSTIAILIQHLLTIQKEIMIWHHIIFLLPKKTQTTCQFCKVHNSQLHVYYNLTPYLCITTRITFCWLSVALVRNWRVVQCFVSLEYTVPIGYSDLGYSGRAAYSDLKPCDGPPSQHKLQLCL